MFRGNHPTRVDDKGRLKIPADFKRVVDERYSAQFFITSVDGKRAQIWPMQEWEEQEKRIEAMTSTTRKKLLDRVSYYGQVAEMDAQGRVLIPQVLRESAKAVGDVNVFGKQRYLEVANYEQFRAELETVTVTADDEAAIAAIGF
jgi:MraZ protein